MPWSDPWPEGIDLGSIHPNSERCPLQAPDYPLGTGPACCWLFGYHPSMALFVFGEHDLRARMFQDMRSAEALAYGRELRETLARLEEQCKGRETEPVGAKWNGRFDDRGEWVWGDNTFGFALAHLRKAAGWYETIGTSGFDVFVKA